MQQPQSYATENSIGDKTKNPACQNCGEAITGQFCSMCGQKYPQDRLTIRELLNLVYESFFDFNRGFFFTVKELFLHPQIVIRHYIDGKRIVYTNPIKYLILWLGLSTFIGLSVLDLDRFTMQLNQNAQLGQSPPETAERKAKREKIEKEVSQIQQFLFQNPQFMYAVLIPVLSLCSLLFFRKQGYTYAEHLVMDSYTMVQTIIITLPTYFFFNVFQDHLLLISMMSSLVAAFYYAFVCILFFKGAFLTALKGILTYLLAYIVLVVLMSVVGGMYAIFAAG